MNETNKKAFLSEVANLLEIDEGLLNDDFELTQCANWDSLTVVSVIGLLDTLFSVNVSIESIEKVQTVAELLALAQPSVSEVK